MIRLQSEHAELSHHPSQQWVANIAPRLLDYTPTPWIPGFSGHFHTILPSFFRQPPAGEVYQSSQWLDVARGGRIRLDIAGSLGDRQRVCIVLHGLSGGSSEAYVQHLVARLRRPSADGSQWTVVAFNARGCGGTSLVSPHIYCGAATDDLHAAVEYVRGQLVERHGEADCPPLAAVGYSLGAAVVTNYVCDHDAPLAAAVSVGAPYDFVRCCDRLEGRKPGMGWLERQIASVYNSVMTAGLREYYMKHRDMLESSPLMTAEWRETALTAQTLREFDALTARFFGFDGAMHYYEEATTTHRIPHDVQVPFLILSADDDPICCSSGVPRAAPARNPHVTVLTTSVGGHLGWMTGWMPVGRAESWSEGAVATWLEAALAQRAGAPAAAGTSAPEAAAAPAADSGPAAVGSAAAGAGARLRERR